MKGSGIIAVDILRTHFIIWSLNFRFSLSAISIFLEFDIELL